ncbi:MAG TPA: glycosyltransferase [Chitinophaga sp.]
MDQRLRIFTWHIHGSYLYYLSQGPYDIFIPVDGSQREGYYGRGQTFPFGPNVIEVPAEDVKHLALDVILFQTFQNYLADQYTLLSETQRALPRIFLQHDPPLHHPVDEVHPVDDPHMVLVHVTQFNRLMFNNNHTPAQVIEHGVQVPDIPYQGDIARGIVVINNLPERGRRLGLDIFRYVSARVPLDLVGMGNGELGLGEVLHPQLPAFISRYRFFFNPIRYTSLGLAVGEAMQLGVPVVGLATTEMATLIRDGENGFLHTDVDYLVEKMKALLADRALAARLGAAGKATAMERFNIQRFVREWEQLFRRMAVGRQEPAGMPA